MPNVVAPTHGIFASSAGPSESRSESNRPTPFFKVVGDWEKAFPAGTREEAGIEIYRCWSLDKPVLDLRGKALHGPIPDLRGLMHLKHVLVNEQDRAHCPAALLPRDCQINHEDGVAAKESEQNPAPRRISVIEHQLRGRSPDSQSKPVVNGDMPINTTPAEGGNSVNQRSTDKRHTFWEKHPILLRPGTNELKGMDAIRHVRKHGTKRDLLAETTRQGRKKLLNLLPRFPATEKVDRPEILQTNGAAASIRDNNPSIADRRSREQSLVPPSSPGATSIYDSRSTSSVATMASDTATVTRQSDGPGLRFDANNLNMARFEVWDDGRDACGWRLQDHFRVEPQEMYASDNGSWWRSAWLQILLDFAQQGSARLGSEIARVIGGDSLSAAHVQLRGKLVKFPLQPGDRSDMEAQVAGYLSKMRSPALPADEIERLTSPLTDALANGPAFQLQRAIATAVDGYGDAERLTSDVFRLMQALCYRTDLNDILEYVDEGNGPGAKFSLASNRNIEDSLKELTRLLMPPGENLFDDERESGDVAALVATLGADVALLDKAADTRKGKPRHNWTLLLNSTRRSLNPDEFDINNRVVDARANIPGGMTLYLESTNILVKERDRFKLLVSGAYVGEGAHGQDNSPSDAGMVHHSNWLPRPRRNMNNPDWVRSVKPSSVNRVEPLCVEEDPLGNQVTTYTDNHMDMQAIRSLSETRFTEQQISGAGNNCWWRSAWLVTMLDYAASRTTLTANIGAMLEDALRSSRSGKFDFNFGAWNKSTKTKNLASQIMEIALGSASDDEKRRAMHSRMSRRGIKDEDLINRVAQLALADNPADKLRNQIVAVLGDESNDMADSVRDAMRRFCADNDRNAILVGAETGGAGSFQIDGVLRNLTRELIKNAGMNEEELHLLLPMTGGGRQGYDEEIFALTRQLGVEGIIYGFPRSSHGQVQVSIPPRNNSQDPFLRREQETYQDRAECTKNVGERLLGKNALIAHIGHFNVLVDKKSFPKWFA